MSDPFWERPEIVDRFADRAPDERLRRVLGAVEGLRSFRVLDIGCAGGRNARFLAERGVDVHALDASEAMVARTRERIAEVLGPSEAEKRVRLGVMSNLGAYGADRFDLVVALGVLQSAESMDTWDGTLSEIRRVLRPGGMVLVASFAPDSRPEGHPLESVAGAPNVFLWRDGRPMVLMDATHHDASFAAHGFHPVEPTETVRVPTDKGYRLTVNGLYRLDPEDRVHAATDGGD